MISSPILRARQTAGILAEKLDMSVKIDERLRERGMGDLNNAQIPTSHRWHVNEILADFPSGFEKWTHLTERVGSFMREMGREKGTTIAVSHGDTIKAAIAMILRLDEIPLLGIRISHAQFTIVNKKIDGLVALCSPIISKEIKNEIES